MALQRFYPCFKRAHDSISFASWRRRRRRLLLLQLLHHGWSRVHTVVASRARGIRRRRRSVASCHRPSAFHQLSRAIVFQKEIVEHFFPRAEKERRRRVSSSLQPVHRVHSRRARSPPPPPPPPTTTTNSGSRRSLYDDSYYYFYYSVVAQFNAQNCQLLFKNCQLLFDI